MKKLSHMPISEFIENKHFVFFVNDKNFRVFRFGDISFSLPPFDINFQETQLSTQYNMRHMDMPPKLAYIIILKQHRKKLKLHERKKSYSRVSFFHFLFMSYERVSPSKNDNLLSLVTSLQPEETFQKALSHNIVVTSNLCVFSLPKTQPCSCYTRTSLPTTN